MDKKVYEIIQFLKERTDQITLQENGDIYCWIPYDCMDEFSKLIGCSSFDDGGIKAILQCDCVFLVINDLLDFFGIDQEIFKE